MVATSALLIEFEWACVCMIVVVAVVAVLVAAVDVPVNGMLSSMYRLLSSLTSLVLSTLDDGLFK